MDPPPPVPQQGQALPPVPNADPLPQRDPERPICAPLQLTTNDVPYILFDIELGKDQFEDVTAKRIQRAIALAPLLYYGRPVTPKENPVSGESHHFIRTMSSRDRKYPVDLLFSDVNWYFKGFRRAVLDAAGNYIWGNWFRFKDKSIALPFYAAPNSQEMGHRGDHDQETTIGGVTVFRDIFYGFARYPDKRHDTKQLSRAVRGTAMYFCEAPRFWEIYLEVLLRGWANTDSVTHLSGKTKHRIGSWGVLCNFVLSTGRNGGVVDVATLMAYEAFYGMGRFDQLIGPAGELRILLRDNDILLDDDLRAELAAREQVKVCRTWRLGVISRVLGMLFRTSEFLLRICPTRC